MQAHQVIQNPESKIGYHTDTDINSFADVSLYLPLSSHRIPIILISGFFSSLIDTSLIPCRLIKLFKTPNQESDPMLTKKHISIPSLVLPPKTPHQIQKPHQIQ